MIVRKIWRDWRLLINSLMPRLGRRSREGGMSRSRRRTRTIEGPGRLSSIGRRWSRRKRRKRRKRRRKRRRYRRRNRRRRRR